jgi:hypothetical protein
MLSNSVFRRFSDAVHRQAVAIVCAMPFSALDKIVMPICFYRLAVIALWKPLWMFFSDIHAITSQRQPINEVAHVFVTFSEIP